MKLYFATSYSPLGELKQLNEWKVSKTLSSYYVLQKIAPEKLIAGTPQGFDCFLDSGAFSALTKNTPINIDKYIEFIIRTKHLWTVYAGLDVIGDFEATAKNQAYMESKGLKPLPTFHYNSPLSELERLCQKYDYIALGGLVPLSLNRKLMQAWLDNCFAIIKKYKTKTHAFGVNAAWAWQRYPFYSVDATSWNQGMKYGRVVNVSGFNMKDVAKKSDRANFIKHKQATWQERTKINVTHFLRLEKLITQLWEKRGIKYD